MLISKLERDIKRLSGYNMYKKPIKGEYLEILLGLPKPYFLPKMPLCCGMKTKGQS